MIATRVSVELAIEARFVEHFGCHNELAVMESGKQADDLIVAAANVAFAQYTDHLKPGTRVLLTIGIETPASPSP